MENTSSLFLDELGYEVGWAYFGHPTPEQKRVALQELLDDTSTDMEDWILVPEIRYDHIGVVQGDFGRGPLQLNHDDCGWAVYGIMKNDPGVHRIIEGQRITVRTK